MTTAILVLNCGSSSIKFALVNPETETALLSGVAEKVGSTDAFVTFKTEHEKNVIELGGNGTTHSSTLAMIVPKLASLAPEVNIIGVGHRVVHGGEAFSASTIISESVLAAIEHCIQLAPLHNPANLSGIKAATKAYPDLPQVAVFDTAFHQTLPEKAYLYALPYALYREHKVRRYGFHGTSYRYICRALAERGLLDGQKIVIAHLGNGASVAAVNNAVCIDTSMGLTPIEGLAQGTRTGDIDPAAIEFLVAQTGKSLEEVIKIYWHESGFLGVSEHSNDCRALEETRETNTGSQRALDLFVYRLSKTIGSYAAAMNGLDMIVFTGGIGENSSYIRAQTAQSLGYLGFTLDDEVNSTTRGEFANISGKNSKSIFIVPTDEERMIALDTYALI